MQNLGLLIAIPDSSADHARHSKSFRIFRLQSATEQGGKKGVLWTPAAALDNMIGRSVMGEYWLKRKNDSEVEGPIGAGVLRRLAAAGKITLNSFISADKIRWVPAPKVRGLFDYQTPSTPAKPVSAPKSRPNL